MPLVHLSTDYVFDGSGERPWREDDPSGPLSVYGASKLAGEKSVQAASGPHLIVRTSWIYAAQGRNFLRTIASLASQRSELRVVADQVGAPTSAAIVANGVVQILGASIDDLPRRFAAAARARASRRHRYHKLARICGGHCARPKSARGTCKSRAGGPDTLPANTL